MHKNIDTSVMQADKHIKLQSHTDRQTGRCEMERTDRQTNTCTHRQTHRQVYMSQSSQKTDMSPEVCLSVCLSIGLSVIARQTQIHQSETMHNIGKVPPPLIFLSAVKNHAVQTTSLFSNLLQSALQFLSPCFITFPVSLSFNYSVFKHHICCFHDTNTFSHSHFHVV